MSKMKTFKCEITDTFGGETNYSWVRRATFEAPSDATDRELVSLGKKALGITGVRCKTLYYGDMIQLDVVGACQRAFIEPEAM